MIKDRTHVMPCAPLTTIMSIGPIDRVKRGGGASEGEGVCLVQTLQVLGLVNVKVMSMSESAQCSSLIGPYLMRIGIGQRHGNVHVRICPS